MRARNLCAPLALAALASAGTPPPGGWPFDHIVIWMQENRAFDHYYGTHQGLRGFGNRAVHPLRSGLPAWYQPSDAKNASQYQLPFFVNTTTSNAQCMPAPAMAYASDILINNGGRLDSWNTAREMGLGPAAWNRYDLPYYYKLLDNFAVGDQYHQSTYTCTNPNRMHLFTGSNGLSVGQAPVLDNTEPEEGYTWTTAGEVLEEAGVSWMVLQMENNFDDDPFAYFMAYKNASSILAHKGNSYVPDLVSSFGYMLGNGTLPQVTYIVGPEEMSEHATWHPSAGEALTSQLLAQLKAHPDAYARTVFIFNYDEGGQFNDYALTPNPPAADGLTADGASTVTVKGEITAEGLPIGPGFRVPLVIVSPWTRGDVVVSEVFDHTSVLRFIEERFNVTFPTISPWRRAMMGDLTSAFNWSAPDFSWPELPDTSNYVNSSNVQCDTLPPVVIPSEQRFPAHEAGVKVSRALPYELLVSDAVVPAPASPGAAAPAGLALSLTLTNTGRAGLPLTLLDVANLASVTPRKYSVGAGAGLTDATLPTGSADTPTQYFYALHGPNGFVRTFLGDVAASGGLGAHLTANLTYDPAGGNVVLSLGSTAPAGLDAVMTVTDNAYGMPGGPWVRPLPGGRGATATLALPVCGGAQGCWYDLTVAGAVPGGGAGGGTPFVRRFMGRMETGRDTISDPAMSAGVPGYVPLPHAAPSEEAWHAAMDAAFPVGTTGSRAARAKLEWGPRGVRHPPTPPHLQVLARSPAQGDHKDAGYAWELPARDEL